MHRVFIVKKCVFGTFFISSFFLIQVLLNSTCAEYDTLKLGFKSLICNLKFTYYYSFSHL